MKAESDRVRDSLQMAELQAQRIFNRDPNHRLRPVIERRLDRLRERQKLLNGDPAAAMKTLWEERLQQPQIDIKELEERSARQE